MTKKPKIEVTYTEGYEKRYTEACLSQLRKREQQNQETSRKAS